MSFLKKRLMSWSLMAALILVLAAGAASAQTIPPVDPTGGADLRRLHPDLRRALLGDE